MGVEKNKWSVDIVRRLLLDSMEVCGAYRRVGCFRWANLLEMNQKQVHALILFLLLARQVRTNKSVSQTREVEAMLSHSFSGWKDMGWDQGLQTHPVYWLGWDIHGIPFLI